jgi:hypothetical protein
VIGYFAKISSTRLKAFSAAACGAIPPVMMSAQPIGQTCSFCTFLVGGGWIGERLGRRLFHLRIVEVQFAVRCDDILTSVSNQKIVERAVGIDTVGRDLEA